MAVLNIAKVWLIMQCARRSEIKPSILYATVFDFAQIFDLKPTFSNF